MLPQPAMSSLRSQYVEKPRTNHTKDRSKDDMNTVSSFWLKQEWLHRYPTKVYTTIVDKIEAQVGEGSNFHIFILEQYF